MHRQPLIALLQRYARSHPDDGALAERFLAFVGQHPDCLSRTLQIGHITASAWILSADGSRCLLTHHRKLGRWLQLGGHVDGEGHVERAALREAEEESGMTGFTLLPIGQPVLPLDLDVHRIPARGDEPAHDHWDVRFLLLAPERQRLSLSSESIDLRWFGSDELAAVTDEQSVLRLDRKARQWWSRHMAGVPGSVQQVPPHP